MGFSIRTRGHSSPEKVRNTRIEQFYQKMNASSHYTKGDAARDFLIKACKGHALILVPSVDSATGQPRRDKYKRLLADVFISGKPGKEAEIANAVNVSELMISNGFARRNMEEAPSHLPLKNRLSRVAPESNENDLSL